VLLFWRLLTRHGARHFAFPKGAKPFHPQGLPAVPLSSADPISFRACMDAKAGNPSSEPVSMGLANGVVRLNFLDSCGGPARKLCTGVLGLVLF